MTLARGDRVHAPNGWIVRAAKAEAVEHAEALEAAEKGTP